MVKKPDTYNHILDIAEELIQTVGFNAFSYADIAARIGIRKASIHYHFPAKTDLGKHLMLRHQSNATVYLNNLIKEHKNHKDILVIYLKSIFASTYEADFKMCLGGMLATDVLTLDSALQNEVQAFFRLTQDWLITLLKHGKKHKNFKFTDSPADIAKQILIMIEGGLLLARLYQDDKWLKTAMKQILTLVTHEEK
ncbi:MAG TPA: TetR/AcrR family transcriptional regulator [Gammaproteobacteria bacterium]|nr:TetR/AcrR family transcriptional regulator [Gammaproteobacteria bacterium]